MYIFAYKNATEKLATDQWGQLRSDVNTGQLTQFKQLTIYMVGKQYEQNCEFQNPNT